MLNIQDHVLTNTAEINMRVAEHLGSLGQVAEQRTLLEASIILAQKAGARRLRTQIAELLKSIPSNSAANSPLKDELIALLDRLGDIYSCESANSGEIHETAAATLEAAVKEKHGESVNIFRYPTLAEFKRFGGRKKAHTQFISLMEQNQAEYANAGDPDYYSPDDKATPGGFYYCFFLKGKGSNGNSLLVTFDTAQT